MFFENIHFVMEFLVTSLIVILYHIWLLPYYLNNIDLNNEIPTNILLDNNTNDISDIYNLSKNINCINTLNKSKIIIFDKLNYTNNSIYIQE